MNKEQAINYLKSSGFSDEQIRNIEKAFTCADCETCRFEEFKGYDFPCCICSASFTFRWQQKEGAEE